MVNDSFLSSVDLALRGGTSALVLLIAGALLRDYVHLVSARLGALFALGTAAYALCSAAGFHTSLGWWVIPALALSAGNNVVFWVFACALFDDAFRLRWWHVGLWLLLVVAGTVDCFIAGPSQSELAAALGIGLTLSSFGFAVLAVAQTVSSWRADLVEGRRRLRLFIVVASSIYIGLTAFSQLLGTFRSAPELASIVSAGGLLAIAGAIAWSLLRIGSGQSLFLPAPAATVDRPQPAPAAERRPEPVDQRLVAGLEQVMTVERAYRQDGLTIGALAQRLNLPEHRLRRLINQALGYRNFNSFLNYYRIAEAKAALADASQSEVPVLTIALDTGFSSLGPFNRAFKAETGVTPSEFRRLNRHDAALTAANSTIGEPVSNSASSNSNLARRISSAP
jgi:AraC-like DNA-binding protein